LIFFGLLVVVLDFELNIFDLVALVMLFENGVRVLKLALQF
jgi:hypothetical protein